MFKNQQIIGSHIIHFDTMESSNTYAHDLLSKSNPVDGTVISADFQSAGKGQGSNKWQAEAGKNILLSVILYPHFIKASRQFYLSIFTVNALIRFLSHWIPSDRLNVKWPNDIYADLRKIGGILIQNTLKGEQIESSVIGIGLNINQLDFDPDLPNPVSLSSLTGEEFDLGKLKGDLIKELDAFYQDLINGNLTGQKAKFEENLLFKGKESIVSTREGMVKGVPLGVADDGRIVMNVDGVVRKLAH